MTSTDDSPAAARTAVASDRTGGRTGTGTPDSATVRTASGIPVPACAGPEHVAAGLPERLGAAGEFPFTRGVRAGMYRERPWTIRQLAGFGTARDTNARYRKLLAAGATGVNGVFDYPSLRAFDSDNPRARSDVGSGGVAVDVADDFDELFEAIPLDRVSVSLVSSQPIGAVPHLAMFLRTARNQGIEPAALSGTSQNDFLMETAITIAPMALPPAASFRLECDVVEYTLANVPRWNPVSVSGYNYREAGADAPLEAALVLAHGQAVARELIRRGARPEQALTRISFFLDAHNDFFEEIAKFRAVRRMWAVWTREELGVTDPRAQRFRFHTQTSGVTNTARHAHVNIARSMTQALSAVLGGTQSLHINGFDEALAIPTEHAALTALRSQYVLLHETGVSCSADPLGGSYLVEYLTDAMQERIEEILERIAERGGLVEATQDGWVHAELARTSYEQQRSIDQDETLVVGVNTQLDGDDPEIELFELPSDTVDRQAERLARVRSRRDAHAHALALDRLQDAARSGENVMPHALRAVDADATLGEIGEVFRTEFGRWEFPLW